MNKGLLFVYLTDFTNQLLTDESIGFYVLKINIYIYIQTCICTYVNDPSMKSSQKDQTPIDKNSMNQN